MTRLFVWLGGVMFVTSLAVCVWWYLFVLGQPSLRMGWLPIVVDAILVTVFALHHSVFAREPVKRAMASAIPERLLRSVYVWIASLLLILVCLLWQPVGGDLYDATGWRAVAHASVQLAGIALIAQSVRAIDPLELAGIRPSSGIDGLQIGGPYRLVRHPLYLGWMLAAFGAAHMTGDRLLFAVLTTLYLAIAIPWEERSLVRSFGESYRRYQQRVRWRMIPFIY
jgi:protein-S-isoprenylcysteine O-methyltransferase Ste14